MNAPYKPLNISLDFRVGEAPEHANPEKCLSSSQAVYELTKEYCKADREIMLLVMVDCKNSLLSMETHTIGGSESAMVYPREIFRSLLLHNASAFMMVHNHPSGDPTPSFADRELTKETEAGGKLLEIKMLDHVILGNGRYFSFADQGEMS